MHIMPIGPPCADPSIRKPTTVVVPAGSLGRARVRHRLVSIKVPSMFHVVMTGGLRREQRTLQPGRTAGQPGRTAGKHVDAVPRGVGGMDPPQWEGIPEFARLLVARRLAVLPARRAAD